MKTCNRQHAYMLPIFAFFFLTIAFGHPLRAAEEDIFAMDLEQLADFDVFAANVLSAHVHKYGELMVGYSYMHMAMDRNRDGTNHITKKEILDQRGKYRYMVAPRDHDMDMHMLMMMYGPTNKLTLMSMIPYIKNTMRLTSRAGKNSTTQSSGLGDIQFNSNYVVYDKETNFGKNEFFFTLGLSLPTGSINKKDVTPMSRGKRVRLPYPMQLGSGTWDLIAGGGYLGIADKWYWGSQGYGTFRLEGENDNGYRLGNRFDLKIWLNRALNDSVSTFIQIDGIHQSNIHGSDPQLNRMMVPTADPNLRAEQSITFNIGIDLYVPEGRYKGNRFSLEYGEPVYQKLDGPQLETDWIGRINWQFAF